MDKIKETKQLRTEPFFGPFWEIQPEICPAAYIFIRPLLSFAAAESASWEHCTSAHMTAREIYQKIWRQYSCTGFCAVLPTSRLFGRISQKWQNKK
jgi:hypothetical protein